MSIFVSIASYRDPQLVPTVEDCLAKARHPEQLRFGICWQHGSEEGPLPFASDPRVRVLDVDWRESRGACWARAEIMKLYAGEDWFLQLDSHHRFVQDWDVKLVQHARDTGSDKPILTTYTTPFHPGEGDRLESGAMRMDFDKFTEEGIVLFRPSVIAGYETLRRSVRARFLSAHFLFTIGDFVKEVPYDPDLYFIGEEITLAVRAFTHGYDLFHPPEVIVWHEYTRKYRTKHWDDHVKTRGVEREWHERDVASRARIKQFLHAPQVGEFQCGSMRTFAEYEAYAGVSFTHRRVQDFTRKGLEPPNPPMPADWAAKTRAYRIRITLDRDMIPAAARSDPQFWYVGFHDADGNEISREDLSDTSVVALLAGDPPRIAIDREFESSREPVTWTVWPVSRADGWLEKIMGPVDRRPAPATLVTALLDIGRGRLAGPFARSFEAHYLPTFERLLAVDAPMVIYIDPKHADVVWRRRRPHNTKVVPVRAEDLRAFPYFDQVQAIRGRADWYTQTGWLRWSPQAALESYNPLVMSKMRWLGDQARENPFGTEHVFWVDAGLCTTIGGRLLDDPGLGRRLADAAGDFLFLGFPYAGTTEIHGFARDALTRVAGVESVDRVIRGGFFGGRTGPVIETAALYDRMLASTLDAGFMGTEESVLTILSYRYPERYRCYMVEETGLIGSFFDALLEGQEERLRLRSPSTAAARGLVATDPEGVERGTTTFLGLRMMQNRNVAFAWDELTRHLAAEGIRPARIIEIGTGLGGLAVLLQVYSLTVGAEFITYDTQGAVGESPLFKRVQIDLRVRDTTHEFVVAEIVAEIQKDGVTLLVCDGGNKVHEVTTFADFLKTGDMIFAHDYAPTDEAFDRRLRGTLWSWCEITDERIQGPITRNALEPLLPETLLAAAWGGWTKRAETVKRLRPRGRPITQVGLYVLGFNAPDQFQAWGESIEAADPAMLDSPGKVLLNNSTDASTFDAYDALCRRWGFQQFRLGNLGINRGRLWCAQHFDGETTLDAMLYFEDDMLLHAEDGLCANGFRTAVPDLLQRAREIVHHENLDFLKLSFTEFFGDHAQHWGYYNLGDAERAELFPDGPRTRVDAMKSYRGVPYIVGDVFYSNWPMLMTRRGNRTMFLDEPDLPLFEQLLMVRALKLARAGALRGGVLLASPVRHHRIHHYAATERKEC